MHAQLWLFNFQLARNYIRLHHFNFNDRLTVVLRQAFEAKRNVYFDYDFNPIEVDQNFPEMIQKSLVGLLYKHEINFAEADMIYCIYFTEELTGAEFEKLKLDWLRYCPLD